MFRKWAQGLIVGLLLGSVFVAFPDAQNFIWGSINGVPLGPGIVLVGSGPVAGSVTLPAMTPGGTTGVYAGTRTLVRIFQAAEGAGGQSVGENVFVGHAGNSTLTNGAGATILASGNIGIGSTSLAATTTGYYNVAVGYLAGPLMTTAATNIAIGALAGRLTTASANNTDTQGGVFLGYNTRPLAASDANTISIGSDAYGAGSNTAVIGNANLTDVYFGSATAAANLRALSIFGRRSVEPNTATKAPAAIETNEVYTNEGDADGSIITLPTAVAGYVYTIYVQAAQTITVTAAAGDTIRMVSGVTAAAGSITSNVVGSAVTLQAINATEWVTIAMTGSWSF